MHSFLFYIHLSFSLSISISLTLPIFILFISLPPSLSLHFSLSLFYVLSFFRSLSLSDSHKCRKSELFFGGGVVVVVVIWHVLQFVYFWLKIHFGSFCFLLLSIHRCCCCCCSFAHNFSPSFAIHTMSLSFS